MCTIAGGAELILDMIHTLRDSMLFENSAEGMTCHECADETHDFVAFGFCEPERSRTLVNIGKWMETVLERSLMACAPPLLLTSVVTSHRYLFEHDLQAINVIPSV